MPQIKNAFDRETLIKIAKGAGIAMGGTLCVYLLQILPGLDFGAMTPMVVGIASILINALREYLKGEEANA